MVKNMKPKFKTIALYSTKKNREIVAMAKQCHEILSNCGVEILIDKNLSKLEDICLKPSAEALIVKKSDLLISIGGDGTMLSCARKYGSQNIPILGINLGNLGFLNDIAPKDLTESLLKVLEGQFTEDPRFYLETVVSKKNERFFALNEVVIHSGEIAQLIEFDLFIDEIYVYTQKADGLIVSSPTGSTAYSLSAGGPIVHPKVDSIIISPMLPLSLNSSSLVVDGNSKIKISLTKSSPAAQISFDSSSNLNLNRKQAVEVSKSKSNLKLIHPKGSNFFEACRNKLGWSNN